MPSSTALAPWRVFAKQNWKGEKKKKKSTKKNCCFEGKRERQRVGESTERSKGSFLSTTVFRAKEVTGFYKAFGFWSQQGVSSAGISLALPNPSTVHRGKKILLTNSAPWTCSGDRDLCPWFPFLNWLSSWPPHCKLPYARAEHPNASSSISVSRLTRFRDDLQSQTGYFLLRKSSKQVLSMLLLASLLPQDFVLLHWIVSSWEEDAQVSLVGRFLLFLAPSVKHLHIHPQFEHSN